MRHLYLTHLSKMVLRKENTCTWTLVKAARSSRLSILPKMYWMEDVTNTVYMWNRPQTSYQRKYEKKPEMSHMRVFSCVAYAHVPDIERRKPDKKAGASFHGICKQCQRLPSI